MAKKSHGGNDLMWDQIRVLVPDSYLVVNLLSLGASKETVEIAPMGMKNVRNTGALGSVSARVPRRVTAICGSEDVCSFTRALVQQV